MPQNFIKTAGKAKVVESLPVLSDAEIGELFYDTANNRLYIRIVAGWKYVGFT